MVKPKLLFIGNYFGTLRAWEEIPERLTKCGYRCITTSASIKKIPRLLDMITVPITQRNSYDLAIIDVFSGLSFFWAEIVSKILTNMKKRYFLVLRGGGLLEFSSAHSKRVGRLLKNASVVITPSNFLKEGLKKFRSDITYIPNGIDIGLFTYLERGEVKPQLIWVRALHSIYQPQMAIRALGLIKISFSDSKLTMVGQDKKDGTREIIEKLIYELDLDSAYSWLGYIPRIKIPEILNHGDIFLNTTIYEGFGTSVLEAAACGLCVVTTNVGELPYLWEEGIDALLVPPNDPERMAAAVMRILTEPGLAARLSANARKKAERYDWSLILPQWEALFMKVLKDG